MSESSRSSVRENGPEEQAAEEKAQREREELAAANAALSSNFSFRPTFCDASPYREKDNKNPNRRAARSPPSPSNPHSRLESPNTGDVTEEKRRATPPSPGPDKHSRDSSMESVSLVSEVSENNRPSPKHISAPDSGYSPSRAFPKRAALLNRPRTGSPDPRDEKDKCLDNEEGVRVEDSQAVRHRAPMSRFSRNGDLYSATRASFGSIVSRVWEGVTGSEKPERMSSEELFRDWETDELDDGDEGRIKWSDAEKRWKLKSKGKGKEKGKEREDEIRTEERKDGKR